MAAGAQKTVFVTVGSTKFDAMVDAVCHPQTLQLLHRKGYTRLTLQVGRSNLPHELMEAAVGVDELLGDHRENLLSHCNLKEFLEGKKNEVSFTWQLDDVRLALVVFRYRGSIDRELRDADLVISHAGAGTSLESLTLGKRLVMVVNDSLMDQHQAELAERLTELRYSVACRPPQLREALAAGRDEHLQPYTPGDPTKFYAYLSSVFVGRPA